MNNQEREAMRELWISRLADLGDSGMTQEEWCKSRSIPYSSLRYWITKLRKESLTENQAAHWLKVDVAPGTEIATIRPPESFPGNSPISIRFSEFTVDIPRGCHEDQLLEVLREPGREATSQSYMWLYRTGRTDMPIVLYEYTEGRSGDYAKAFLKGFSGYLHTDYSDKKVIPIFTR